MRVLFFGTSAFAVPSLEALVTARHAVVLCVTQPDRPQGRGLGREPSPVKRAAARLQLPLAQPERLEASACQSVQADIGVVAAYGNLISRELLDLPRHGMLGVHPSLLPKYRGAAPVAWALLNGETATGVTIFRLNERLDAGELLTQRRVAIEHTDDAEALTGRLAQLGAEELVRGVAQLEAGQARWTPQDDAQATFAPKLTKAQGRVNWSEPAEVIERLVRAAIPWPGASTELSGETIKVWRVAVERPGAAAAGAQPGTVVHVAAEAIGVATGSGVLELLDVQPAGRRRMTVNAFLAGHPIKVGDRCLS